MDHEKENQGFIKPMFMQPLGNSLPSVYSGSLKNGDISLKSLSFKVL